ncbi:MAG: V-type ATP synthase subunit C [Clostridia bacterium]|nr:V-type ATP synthase subunit C [Clostridia bacterium]
MSDKKITDYDYLYLTSALRAKEPKKLTKDKMDRMLDAQNFEDAAKMLMECGYADMSGMAASALEKALNKHRTEIFEEIRQLIPEHSVLDAFCLKYDYHNAKVLIKAESANVDGRYLLSDSGMVSVERLIDAYQTEDYEALPKRLGKALEEARGVLKRTENAQLADFILDRAYFEEMKETAGKLYSPFLSDYVNLTIDGANLRATVRTLRMGRDSEFLKNALIEGGSIDSAKLIEAVAHDEGFEALYLHSPFSQAAALGQEALHGGRLTEFEKSCDNVLINFFAGARDISFGAAPVIAYIAGLENEITAARMILSGKLSGVEPSLIRERLRDICA